MKRLLTVTLALVLLSAGLVVGVGNHDIASAHPDNVLAGHDLFETVSAGDETFLNFTLGNALPADFFGPGSDPFEGLVVLEGVPFDSFASFSGLTPTDTIVERKQVAGPVFPDTIAIEIVRLELRSVDPLTVTYNGGQDPELWDMTAQVLEGPNPAQTQGTMTIRHEYADGGTFDSTLPVTPLVTLTKQGGGGEMAFPAPVTFTSTDEPWCHTGGDLDDPAGHVLVEVTGLTENFFPGVICPDSPGGGGQKIKTVVGHLAEYAAHDVKFAETEGKIGGVAELQDVDATPLEATESSGPSAGLLAGIAGAVMATVAAVGGAVWYVRRRQPA